MLLITHKNRAAFAAKLHKVKFSETVSRLERDWIGNVYIKFNGIRHAFLFARFSYADRGISEGILRDAGFVLHPTKKGLGDRQVWVIPGNE